MKRIIFTISCFIYFFSSVFINLLGQLSVNMMEILNISQSDIALILTLEAIGGIFASIYLGFFGERYDKLKTVIISTAMMSLGTMLMIIAQNRTSYYLIIFFLMIANIGYISIDLTINSMISQIYSEDKNRLLPIIHIFYGLGAMAAPLFCILCSRIFSDHLFNMAYFLLGVILAILTITLFMIAGNQKTTTARKDITDPFEIYKNKNTWYLLAVAIFYALFQSGIASWLPDYNINALNMSSENSAFIMTLYFAASLLMRLLSTFILSKISGINYYSGCGIIAAIMLTIALSSDNAVIYTIFLLMTGFFIGGLVPTFMIVATDRFPKRQSSSTSIFVLAVCISNLSAPLFGKIIESGSHRTAMYLIMICLLISSLMINVERNNKDE